MPENSDPPPKQDVAQALLLRGSAFVYLDPRCKGVVVPDHLRKQPQLVLQIGLDLTVPIPDLTVDEDGIFATLSFNRAPFPCTVPWSAVFGLVSDDAMGVVWQEDLPSEIAAEVELATIRAEKKAQGPKLRAIDGGASGGGDGSIGAVASLKKPAGLSSVPAVSAPTQTTSDDRPSDDKPSDDRPSDDRPSDDRPSKRPHLRLVE